MYQLSYKSITTNLSYHPETKAFSMIIILSNGDLDIWPFGHAFNSILGYPFSYTHVPTFIQIHHP